MDEENKVDSNEEDVDESFKNAVNIIALCPSKEATVGISFYCEENGHFRIAEVNFNVFHDVFDHIILVYEPTHIIMPKDTFFSMKNTPKNQFEEEMLKFIESMNVIPIQSNLFGFKGGIEEIQKMIFTAPSIEQEKIRKQVLTGIIDLSSKAIVSSISGLCSFFHEKRHNAVTISSFGLMDEISPLGLSTNMSFSLSQNTMNDIQIIRNEKNPSIHNIRSRSKDGLSLYILLNRCSTTMGKRKLKHWFFSELSNQIDSVKVRLDTIEELTNPANHVLVNETVSHLENINDLTLLIPSLQKGAFKLKQWQNLTKSLKLSANLCEYIASRADKNCPDYVLHLFSDFSLETITKLRKLAQRIDSTIDFNSFSTPSTTKTPAKGSNLKTQDVHVCSECDSKLHHIRDVYNSLDVMLDKVAKDLIDELPVDCQVSTLSVVYIPQLGFLTTVHKSHGLSYNDLPTNFQLSFETDTHWYCKNSKVTDLDNEYGDIYQDIISRELEIITKLSEKILVNSAMFSGLMDAIGQLDALCSLAVVAVEGHWVKPVFNERELIIEGGRHPLMERCTDSFIPNDTQLLDGEPKIHVITGPNGSGKSIYIKQIALIIFLAHIGSFVPAEKAIIPMIDSIFTVFHSSIHPCEPFSSSFADDVKNLANVMEKCTSKSLVLLDEFGKTSNHLDGASLLSGFIHSIASRGIDNCPFIFISTHFRDAILPQVLDNSLFIRCTMSVTFIDDKDNDNICFTYKMRKGTEDEDSLGFECAKRAGLQNDIVERAKDIASFLKKGKDIPPNPKCKDPQFETKAKKALTLFFNWDCKSNPRTLLAAIDEILQ